MRESHVVRAYHHSIAAVARLGCSPTHTTGSTDRQTSCFPPTRLPAQTPNKQRTSPPERGGSVAGLTKRPFYIYTSLPRTPHYISHITEGSCRIANKSTPEPPWASPIVSLAGSHCLGRFPVLHFSGLGLVGPCGGKDNAIYWCVSRKSLHSRKTRPRQYAFSLLPENRMSNALLRDSQPRIVRQLAAPANEDSRLGYAEFVNTQHG